MAVSRMRWVDVPLLMTAAYAIVPGFVGIVYAFMEPDRSVWLYGGIPALIGLAIGLYAEYRDDPLAKILRLPAEGLFALFAASSRGG